MAGTGRLSLAVPASAQDMSRVSFPCSLNSAASSAIYQWLENEINGLKEGIGDLQQQ